MKLSKSARVGFFAAAAATMGAVCAFHASHVGAKTPHINVANFGDAPNPEEARPQLEDGPQIYLGGHVHIQGMDVRAPLENFEKAFNRQLDEQDKDRSHDYLFAALADGAGAIAALVSVFIEAAAVEENSSEPASDETDKPGHNRGNERSPEDSRDRSQKEEEAAESNNNPTHKTHS